MTPVSQLQETRMRGYFIQATKEILRGEGIRGISVRNIAEQAGYSYATLYNYFKDVRDLIFECVRDFQEECELMVQDETQSAAPGLDKIEATFLSVTKYFIQYPGIFELFYIEKMSDIDHNRSTCNMIVTFLPRLTGPDWEICVAQKFLTETEADTLMYELNWTFTGLLLFYLNRNDPESYDEFMQRVRTVLQSRLFHLNS